MTDTGNTAAFPVAFDDPQEAELQWQLVSHPLPQQTPPLEYDLYQASVIHGVSLMHEQYQAPMGPSHLRLINTYSYTARTPPQGSPDELDQQTRESENTIYDTLLHLDERWQQRWLPEIKDHIAALEHFDATTTSVAALRQHLGELGQRVRRLWELHMLIVTPAYVAVSEFDEFYRDLFSPDDPFAAYTLLRGLPTKTFESGMVLWELSRSAAKDPDIEHTLRTQAAEDVPAELARHNAGQRFLAEFHAYLHEYGQRAETIGLAHPSWIEDPTPAVRNLQNYLTQPDHASPSATLDEAATQREHAVADARRRLDGYPQPVVDRFEQLLTAAQTGNVLTEDHNFYIDCRSMYQARRPLVAAGQHLADAAVLDNVDDVFLLHLDELRTTLDEYPHLDRRALAAERRAHMEHFNHITPPATLGDGTTSPLPSVGMMGRFMDKFGMAPVDADNTERIDEDTPARGAPGSPGHATGTARIVRTLAEAERLQPGDVLVAPNTAPSWTPLFASAAAIVTDSGGILSHCAVVAREYGVPAVVGLAGATTTITDGRTVAVDGDNGTVHIEPDVDRDTQGQHR